MKLFLTFTLIYLNNYTFILGHVEMTYPNGTESFSSGEILNIRWYPSIEHGECNWDLFFSTDNGNSWSEILLDISQSQLEYEWKIPDIGTAYAKIRVIQDNSNYNDYSAESKAFTIMGAVSDVTYQNEQIKDFVVYPAYPNPFNSSTTISFNLLEKDFVEVNIFNVSGQKIKTLINRVVPSGNHKITWKADEVNSGVYFYVIQTSQAIETRKLIFIK